MSIELTQKLVAGTLIVGGLWGGYYALTGGSGGTLFQLHEKDERELITDGDTLAQNYSKADDKDLIEGIKKTDSKAKDKIKKGCESKGSTYYTSPTDKTYQSYSLGCLVEANLDKVLTKQGYQWKDEIDKGEKKFEKYKQSFQTFLDPKPSERAPAVKPKVPKEVSTPHTKDTLKVWCESSRKGRYKYQGDDDEHRTRNYCYGSEAQLEEANKPVEPETIYTSPGSQGN